ncbi:MAG: hypothetical protein M5R36_18055 [Deltaproteobacteria bacterium]|nr:hypothetical protein [Deltaproteobacteria bacterium]
MDAGVKTAPGLTAGELLGVVRMLTIDLPKHVRGASVAHVVFAWGVPLLSIAVLGVKNFRVDKYRRAAELFFVFRRPSSRRGGDPAPIVVR